MTDKVLPGSTTPDAFPSAPVRVSRSQGCGVCGVDGLGPLVSIPEIVSLKIPPGTLAPKAVTVPMKLHVPVVFVPVLMWQVPPVEVVKLVMSRRILPVGPTKLSTQTCPLLMFVPLK